MKLNPPRVRRQQTFTFITPKKIVLLVIYFVIIVIGNESCFIFPLTLRLSLILYDLVELNEIPTRITYFSFQQKAKELKVLSK